MVDDPRTLIGASPALNKILVGRKEAAERLSVSVRTLDNLIRSNQLVARRIGARVLVSCRELENFARRAS
jgi:excisionase family DNA binding protein